MKKIRVSPRRRESRTNAARRAQLLAAFDGSGLSAAAFARQHGLTYTTFCGWRQRRDRGRPAPAFVQVELPEPAPPVELVIELGRTARLRLTDEVQIPLAAHLLQACNVSRPC
jgi:transposase-like protein